MSKQENNEKKPAPKQGNNSFFRKKSLDRISSPDQLYDYIHVTTPSVWVVLLAVFILLAGMIVWCFAGSIEVTGDDMSISSVHPIEFVIN